jgi:hypothetical protein
MVASVVIRDARAVIGALADPQTLYVFGVIVARTSKEARDDLSPGTRSLAYVTPFGLMRETSLPRDVIEAAAERLRQAGLLDVLTDDERGYGSWRVSEDALAAAAAGSGDGAPRSRRG